MLSKCGVLTIKPKATLSKVFVVILLVMTAVSPDLPALVIAAIVLAHTTKRCLKHSALIIKILVSKGNQTPDLCYNDRMVIILLAQTSWTD